MALYKDLNNIIHDDMYGNAIHMIPQGSVQITDEEANKLRLKNNIKPTKEEILAQRNALLAQTDWTQMPDVVLTKEQAAAYKKYRQELRDISNQKNFPNVIWPKLNIKKGK